MAGTLTISTLSDGTNSTSSTNCIQGSAKAWVNFASSSGTVSASYNVSSVTRSGVGLYIINFTSAFADTKYIPVIGGECIYGVTSVAVVNSNIATKSTTQLGIICVNSTFSLADLNNINVAVFR